MKKLLLLLLSFTVTFNLFGVISGSVHDFSGNAWSGGEICVVCHVPHGADTTIADSPLWSHDVTTSTFTTYTSATITPGLLGQPDGVSKLCLSCHDGTVALDAFVGGAGTAGTIAAAGDVGTDMNANHPVSFVYDTAAAADTEIKAADGTINGLLVGGAGGNMECSSCHDVHNTTVAADPLLRISNAASALCLTCHDK